MDHRHGAFLLAPKDPQLVDINRNQFFMVGIVVVLLGLQFRLVDNYVLNEKTTRFLASKTTSSKAPGSTLMSLSAISATLPRKVVHPPEWSGWCLMSIGSVLILHSLALRRPD